MDAFDHITKLVNSLRQREDVKRYFRDHELNMARAPGDFLHVLLPDLSEGAILSLAFKCKSAEIFLAARALLLMPARRVTHEHNPLADTYREVRLIDDR